MLLCCVLEYSSEIETFSLKMTQGKRSSNKFNSLEIDKNPTQTLCSFVFCFYGGFFEVGKPWKFGSFDTAKESLLSRYTLPRAIPEIDSFFFLLFIKINFKSIV